MARLGVRLLLVSALWLLAGAVLAESVGPSYQDAERAFRAERLEDAEKLLRALLENDPAAADAQLLLGFVRYRQGDAREAHTLFHGLLSRLPGDADVVFGLALSKRALGDLEGALRYARWAARLAPARYDIAEVADRLTAELGDEPITLGPFMRPEDTRTPVRAEGGVFRLENGAVFIVRGVNLGMAQPGRFATEFPDDAIFTVWLEQIAAMNANTVRLYTTAPPAFYRALRAHNLAHPENPLYLLQGVWTEPPADGDYHGAFKVAFLEESYRVVELLHGQAVIEERANRAWGVYEADVSSWLLGLILGREWEVASVRAFDAQPEAPKSYQGRFFSVQEGSAMEAWLAEVMDAVSSYQLDTFNHMAPIAFVNWLSLAPRDGPGVDRGERQDAPSPFAHPFVYGDETTVVDAARISASTEWEAGHFASYHAFPYYPDFLRLDPLYNVHPRSSYMAHLERLKAHHGEQTVLVSEFGVPSSRGQSRPQPQGYHQGGNDERAQAELLTALYSEILDSGLAGGVVFAWLDEWFKRHWLFDTLERPLEHLPRWHSVMNPEQNYGLIAFDAPDEPALGSAPGESASRVAARGELALFAQVSASYLHLWLEATAGAPPRRVRLSVDTHPVRGPEFQLSLTPTEGVLFVNAAYQPFKRGEDGVYSFDLAARPEAGTGWARWRAPSFEDGTPTPGELEEPGRLRPGLDPEGGRDGLADYALSAHGLHLRLPWTLLMVTDPSAGFVFDGEAPGRLVQIDDLGLWVATESGALSGRFDLPRWQVPETTARFKPAYYALQRLWAD